MEANILVTREPVVVLWFMSAQVIQDDMDFLFGRHVFDDLVHEIKELTPPSPSGMHECRGPLHDTERGEKSGCPVSFVLMGKSGDCLAVRQTQVTLRPLQRLNVGFFIDRDDEGAFAALAANSGSVETHHE